MLAAMLAIVLSAVVLGGDATRAAPAAGSAVERFHATSPVAEPVHCRRWPHWHSGAKPHGFGFGCGLKKPKPARPQRAADYVRTNELAAVCRAGS
jgi:hypothetical protein